GVMRRYDRNILPMVAEIEHQHIESWQQVLPVGKIGVGGKTVAVRHEQADAIGVAMTPHSDLRAVVERNVEGHAGSGNFEAHRKTRRFAPHFTDHKTLM